MRASELVPSIHLAHKGKSAEKAPASTDAKYQVYLTIASDAQDRWAEDPDNDWPELFGGDVTATVVNGSTALDAAVCRSTDPIYWGDTEIPIVHFSDRNTILPCAYITGKRGSRVIHFNGVENLTGDSVKLGIINYAPRLDTTQADVDVTCSNTRWLSYQSAAMLARNDPAKEDEADRLFGLANVEYKEMSARNVGVKRRKNRVLRNRYPRIPGL